MICSRSRNAIEEGVEFVWLPSPKVLLGRQKVEFVEEKMKLENLTLKRRRPEIQAGLILKL